MGKECGTAFRYKSIDVRMVAAAAEQLRPDAIYHMNKSPQRMIPTYTQSVCQFMTHKARYVALTLLTSCALLGWQPLQATPYGLGTSAAVGQEVITDFGAIPLLGQWQEQRAEQAIIRHQSLVSSAAFAPCYTGFVAGNDTTYCAGEEATLDGGYDSFSGTSDILVWTIVGGSGTGGFELNGFPVGSSANSFNNFNTSFNSCGACPTVTYVPSATDTVVTLRLTATPNPACDIEIDEVTLYFDPIQEAELQLDVNGANVLASATSTSTNQLTMCSGDTLDMSVINSLVNGGQNSDLPFLAYTITTTGPILGLPSSDVEEAADFNSTFTEVELGLPGSAGAPETATISVVTFYDRDNSGTIEVGECEGDAVEIEITVLPQAQATSGIVGGLSSFCVGETALIRITGSPSSTVTYAIDLGDGGGFGADQTTMIPALGSNTDIAINTTGLGGNTITFALRQVEYSTGAACPRSLTETEIITVLDRPDGSISLENSEDAVICNDDASSVSLKFTTTSPDGDYRLYLSQQVDASGPYNFLSSFDVTVASGMGTFSANLAPTNVLGVYSEFRLDSLLSLSVMPNCVATGINSTVLVIEQAEAFVAFDVSINNGSDIFVDSDNDLDIEVCDGSSFDLDIATPNGYGVDISTPTFSQEMIQLVIVDVNDRLGFGGSGTYVVDIENTFLYSLSANLDIPNNATSDEVITITATPYFESDGVSGFDAGEECSGDNVNLEITILRQIDASMTASDTEICENDMVTFTITSNTEGTARLVQGMGGTTINVPVTTGSGPYTGTYTTPALGSNTSYTFVDFVRNSSPTCETEFNQTINIDVEPRPLTGTINLGMDTLCSGDSTYLFLSATGGNGTGYKFRVDSAGTNRTYTVAGSDTIIPLANNAAGIYIYRLRHVRNAGGLMCRLNLPNNTRDTLYVEDIPHMAITGSIASADGMVDLNTDGGPLSDRDTLCSGEEVVFETFAGSNDPTSTGNVLAYRIEVVQDPTNSVGIDTIYVPAAIADGNMIPLAFTNPFSVAVDVDIIATPFYANPSTFTGTEEGYLAACKGDTLSLELIINPTPNATFGGNQTICAGDSALLDFTGPNSGSVTLTVVSGDTSNLGGMNNMVDTIYFSPTGEGFYNTGALDSTTVFRVGDITTDTSANPICINVNTFDVTVIVVDLPDAAFLDVEDTICQGSDLTLDLVGTPNSFVFLTADSLDNMGTSTFSVGLDDMGEGSFNTTGLFEGEQVDYVIDSVALDTAGNTCVNTAPLHFDTLFGNSEVFLFETPVGTINSTENLCVGDTAYLVFDITSGTSEPGDSFTIVVNSTTYTVADGETFQAAGGGLSSTTLFSLTSITQDSFPFCQDTFPGVIDTVSVIVEDVPTATLTLDYDSEITVVTAATLFADTVCAGGEFDMSVTGTPAGGSQAGDPLYYEVMISDADGLLGFGPSFNTLLSDAAANMVLDGFFPATIENNGTSPSLIEVSFLPYYETDPGGPFGGDGPDEADACPGDTTRFTALILPTLQADFDSPDETICQDSMATVLLDGTPNTEVTIFDGGNVFTVDIDGMGDGSFSTGPLSTTTTYQITGSATVGQDPACTRVIFGGPTVTITVVPTPVLDSIAVLGNDTTCTDQSKDFRIYTTNAVGGTVHYVLNGIAGSGPLNGNGRLTVPASFSNTGLTVDSFFLRVDSIITNTMPPCIDFFADSTALYVKPLPTGTITPVSPVCNGDSVAIVFNALTQLDNTYRLRIRHPNGTLFPAFNDVESGDTVFYATDPGVYYLKRIQDNRDGDVSCDNNTDGDSMDNLDSALVIIEEVPNLQAVVTAEVGVIGLDNQMGISTFNPIVCDGESLDAVFNSLTLTSDPAGDNNPLYVEVEVVADPDDLLGDVLAMASTDDVFVLPLADLEFDGPLNNPGMGNSQLHVVLTPYFENGTDTDSLNMEECAGPTLSFNLTILPAINAMIDTMASDTEVCVDDIISIVVSGTPGGEVEFTTMGMTSPTASPIVLDAMGYDTIFGTAIPGTNAQVNLTEITVTTTIGPVTKVCMETLMDSIEVTVNPVPYGYLFADPEGPICNGATTSINLSGSPGAVRSSMDTLVDGSYTLTINGEDVVVTVDNDSAFVYDVTLFADSTFTLTRIENNTTGCFRENMMGLSTVTVQVEEVPTGAIYAYDEMGMPLDTVENGVTDTFFICTGDSLFLDAIYTGSGSVAGASEYVQVTYDAALDYYGIGTTGDTAVAVDDFEDVFSARYQNLTNNTDISLLTATWYFEDTTGTGYSGAECTGITDSFYIFVSPNPITSDIDTMYCSGEVVDIDLGLGITNGVIGATFTYTSISSDPMGVAAPADRTVASNDRLVDTFTNLSGADVTITYTVTPMVGNCVGNDYDLRVLVKPEPGVFSAISDTICSGDQIGIEFNDTTGLSPVFYELVDVELSVMSPDFIADSLNAAVDSIGDSELIEDDTYVNLTNAIQTVTYTVAPFSADTCYGDTVVFSLGVYPEPKVDSVSIEVCSGTRLDIDIINDLVENQVGEVVRYRRSIIPGAPIIVLNGNDNDDNINFNNNGNQVNPNLSFDQTIMDSLINTGTASLSVSYNIRVRDTLGCGNVKNFILDVLIREEADATLDAVTTSDICSGDAIELDAIFTGLTSPTYVYSVENQDPGVDTVILTPSVSGSSVFVDGRGRGQATVRVTVSDSSGCTASATELITIDEVPVFTGITGEANPCTESPRIYSVMDPDPAVSYSWTVTGGTLGQNVGSTTDVTWSSPGGGPFELIVTGTSPILGCTSSDTLVVMTTDTTQAGFNYAVDTANTLMIDFIDESVGDVISYAWDFGDGVGTSTMEDPTYTYAMPGVYNVCLTAVGVCGASTFCENVIVLDDSQFGCDTVYLNAGLNLISFDVQPLDSSMATVFSGELGSNLLSVQGRDFDTGNPTLYVAPTFPFNSLLEVERGEGYFVRVLTADTMIVCGEILADTFKKDLRAGINLVGYVPQAVTTPNAYFADLITSSNLLSASAYDPTFKFFIAGFPLNTLTEVRNSKGYEVRLNNAVAGADWLVGDDEQFRTETDVTLTNSYDFIAGYSNLPASAEGDYVEIVDAEGNMINQMLIMADGMLMTAPVFGHDTQEEELRGIETGTELYLRYAGETIPTGVYFGANRELHLIDVVFNGISSSVNALSSTSISELSAFPNPFQNQLDVEIELTETTELAIEMYDFQGRKVATLLPFTRLTTGTHRLTWEPSGNLAAGNYRLLVRGKAGLLEQLPLILQR